MSEAQIQQRTMQLSQFVNKIQVVDSFPSLVDRLTVCLFWHNDKFRLYWALEPQVRTFADNPKCLTKSMVATSFAVVKWDGPLMGVRLNVER